MNVLELIEDEDVRAECEQSPAFWLGSIGWAAAHAVGHWRSDPEWHLGVLRRTLDEYIDSRACPAETRKNLQKEMR